MGSWGQGSGRTRKRGKTQLEVGGGVCKSLTANSQMQISQTSPGCHQRTRGHLPIQDRQNKHLSGGIIHREVWEVWEGFESCNSLHFSCAHGSLKYRHSFFFFFMCHGMKIILDEDNLFFLK